MALGVCYMELKRFEDAQTAYRQALKALQLSNDEERIAGTYTNLGILSAYEEKFEESIQFFLESIQLYKKLGADQTKLLNAQAELAKTYYFHGDLDKAIKLSEEIIQYPKETISHAYAYEILGEAQIRNAKLRKALDYYEAALNLFVKLKRRDKEGEVQKKMAEVYLELGECLKAAEHFRRCCC